ncbi:MAG TPA: hypothetical protein ENL21_04735, partial [Caldithrix abyssi]|nr:hypothetical protein [Caldithrix abyssi]
MKKVNLILLLAFLMFSKNQAQTFDEVSFLHNLKTSYYLLINQPVENFVVKITSAKLDAFT